MPQSTLSIFLITATHRKRASITDTCLSLFLKPQKNCDTHFISAILARLWLSRYVRFWRCRFFVVFQNQSWSQLLKFVNYFSYFLLSIIHMLLF